jgi:hypothetical protein
MFFQVQDMAKRVCDGKDSRIASRLLNYIFNEDDIQQFIHAIVTYTTIVCSEYKSNYFVHAILPFLESRPAISVARHCSARQRANH